MPNRISSISKRLELRAIGGLPMIAPGDDLAAMIVEAAARDGSELCEGDVIVVAQKVVSKAENRIVKLEAVTPSPQAVELAAKTDKDPRIAELILRESNEILRHRPGLIVVVHRRGWILANAGIDQSNVGPDHEACALLLPADPDHSAAVLRQNLRMRCGVSVAVIVNDSLGRAWRLGTVGTALGVAGLSPLLDLRGKPDLFGRTLKHTIVGHADEIAAAASLLQGQADEGAPVVIVRGLAAYGSQGCGADMIRKASEDLFR